MPYKYQDGKLVEIKAAKKRGQSDTVKLDNRIIALEKELADKDAHIAALEKELADIKAVQK